MVSGRTRPVFDSRKVSSIPYESVANDPNVIAHGGEPEFSTEYVCAHGCWSKTKNKIEEGRSERERGRRRKREKDLVRQRSTLEGFMFLLTRRARQHAYTRPQAAYVCTSILRCFYLFACVAPYTVIHLPVRRIDVSQSLDVPVVVVVVLS